MKPIVGGLRQFVTTSIMFIARLMFVASLCFCLHCRAQTMPPSNVVFYGEVSTAISPDDSRIIEGDTTFEGYDGVALVTLSDTLGLDSIHLKIGTYAGGTDIVDHVFDYDLVVNLPVGFYYHRIGQDVYLRQSQYSLSLLHSDLYVEVRLFRAGISSPPFYFHYVYE